MSCIRVFTGDGKGKTTAALGQALRAVGRGRNVFMVQFLKAPETSGEHFAARRFSPLLTIKPMGKKGFIRRSGPDALDKSMAAKALLEAGDAMSSGKCDMVILDEINVAVHLGLISAEDIMAFLDRRPKNVELILTGRYAHPLIVDKADSVLEVRKVKHPFDSGIDAMEGIEY